MAHSNVISISPIAQGERPDSIQEVLLRSAFSKFPVIIFELKTNSVLQEIVRATLEKYPRAKNNLVWVAEMITLMNYYYVYLCHQPAKKFELKLLETKEEWIGVLTDLEIKNKFRHIELKDGKSMLCVRLPEILINVITNDGRRQKNVHTMEDLVSTCLNPDHKEFVQMEVLFFLAANIVSSMTIIENMPDDNESITEDVASLF